MSTNCPSSPSILKKQLKKVFGFDKFKNDLQEKAVRCVFEGKKDCFISMPTGAGKSLCYQLPAVCKEIGQLIIVISPLIALMNNQIDAMRRLNIRTETINSTLSKSAQDKIKKELFSKNCSIRLLYLTPEMIANASFTLILDRLYKNKTIFAIAIDEAHCVSQWGHDFRPDYLKLGLIKQKYNDLPFIALTATASSQVAADIVNSLHLRQPTARFVSSPFRKNLFYDVLIKDLLQDPLEDLKQFAEEALEINSKKTNIEFGSSFVKAVDMFQPKVEKKESKLASKNVSSNQASIKDFIIGSKNQKLIVNNKCLNQLSVGIVYCRTRQTCDDIAFNLTKKGLSCASYHAGLKISERKLIQEKWMKGEVKCIAATISFGMGVDKADVRFVAHWNLPQSLIGYYQESGRAGRDSKLSRCRIYYSRNDRDAIRYLLSNDFENVNSNVLTSEASQAKIQIIQEGIRKFERMVEYCENFKACRHLILIKEFDCETDFKKCEDKCDVCVNPKTTKKIMNAMSNLMYQTFSKSQPIYNQECEDDNWSLPKFDDSYKKETEDCSKKESMMSIVQDEFARRRKKLKTQHENSKNVISTQNVQPQKPLSLTYLNDDCKVLEASSTRIKDVDLKLRTMFLTKLKFDLWSHYKGFIQFTPVSNQPLVKLKEKEISNIAAQSELKIFNEKNTKITYKAAFADLFRRIKLTNNTELHSIVNDYIKNKSNKF